MTEFNFDAHLGNKKTNAISYSEFLTEFFERPSQYLHTSSSIIADSIRHFGYGISIRSGEPVVRYKVFSDPFSDGINASFGHEFSIERILDVVDSSDKESYINRGIVFAGPPSSGKTNIVDLTLKAMEE